MAGSKQEQIQQLLSQINGTDTLHQFDPNYTSRKIQQFKSMYGATDDELKPLYDALQSKGYSVNLNGDPGQGTFLTGGPSTGGSTAPGQFTPATPTGPAAPTDRQQIEDESSREATQSQDVLDKQLALRTGGLSSLGDILQKQNQAQFNYDLPGIKEQLQGEGVYQSPSALANAVARESSMLGANTTAQLGQYGLGNIDLQTQGLGSILQNKLGLQQGGLQRQFSVGDYDKQAALAREIGAATTPQSPGTFSTALSQGLGGAATGATIGSAVPGLGTAAGAGVGGALGLIQGIAKGGGK